MKKRLLLRKYLTLKKYWKGLCIYLQTFLKYSYLSIKKLFLNRITLYLVYQYFLYLEKSKEGSIRISNEFKQIVGKDISIRGLLNRKGLYEASDDKDLLYLQIWFGQKYDLFVGVNLFAKSINYTKLLFPNIKKHSIVYGYMLTEQVDCKYLIDAEIELSEYVVIIEDVCLSWTELIGEYFKAHPFDYKTPITDCQNWMYRAFFNWSYAVVFSGYLDFYEVYRVLRGVSNISFLRKYAYYVNGEITGKSVAITQDDQRYLFDIQIVPGFGLLYEFVRSMSWLICNEPNNERLIIILNNVDSWIDNFALRINMDLDRDRKDIELIKSFRFLRACDKIITANTFNTDFYDERLQYFVNTIRTYLSL